MTQYERLLDDIDDNKELRLVMGRSHALPAVSFPNAGKDYIFFDESGFGTEAERLVALAHEKAHCDTGVFYSVKTPLMTRGYCERRAWRQTILDALPFDKLMEAFEECKTDEGVEIYDLSEYLDLPEDFIAMAIEEYVRMGKEIL